MAPTSQALQVAPPLLVGLTLVLLAALVWKTARERVTVVFFSTLYLLSGLKSLSEALLPIASDLQAQAPAFPGPAFWLVAAFACASLMIPSLLLFVLHFPRPIDAFRRDPRLRFVWFLPGLVLAILGAVQPGPLSYNHAARLLNLLAVASTLYAALHLARLFRTTTDPIERTRTKYVLVGFLPAFAGTWTLSVLAWVGNAPTLVGAARFFVGALPFLELLAAGATGYALVKYQLLGAELRVRRGVKYALTGVVLVVGLFVVKESFEQLIEPIFAFTELSWLLTAIVGTVAFRPIERAADRLSALLFPATRADPSTYRDQRAREIYHAQFAYVVRDQAVTERERRFLDHLREQLGLAADAAGEVETEVLRLLPGLPGARASPADPPTGGS